MKPKSVLQTLCGTKGHSKDRDQSMVFWHLAGWCLSWECPKVMFCFSTKGITFQIFNVNYHLHTVCKESWYVSLCDRQISNHPSANCMPITVKLAPQNVSGTKICFRVVIIYYQHLALYFQMFHHSRYTICHHSAFTLILLPCMIRYQL